MTSKTEIPDSLRAILQVVLVGAITPDMRLIALKFEDKALTIRIYFDKPPTSDNIESASIIGTNVSVMGGFYQRRVRVFPGTTWNAGYTKWRGVFTR